MSSWLGEALENIGVALGDLGVRWRCVNCGLNSREYTGNIVDGTAKCPRCGLNPVIPGSKGDSSTVPPVPQASGVSSDEDGSSSDTCTQPTPPKRHHGEYVSVCVKLSWFIMCSSALVPKLYELSFMEFHGQQVRVIDDAAPEWKALALRLQFDGAAIKTINQSTFYQPVDACREMLHQWLCGKGLRPSTWNTLIAAFRDIDESSLANKLDRVVQ